MWLVAGLGNPGTKYEQTRHNIGFRVADELARRHGFAPWRAGKLGGDASVGAIRGVRACLLKPMEFMNLSGFAVQRAAKFHGVEPGKIVIIHDELDLEPGTTRVKLGGGHGGHNGLRSLLEQLGTPDFARVRVGIGRPPVKGGEVASWVLGGFPPAISAEVGQSIQDAADAVEACLTVGPAAAMNRFNSANKSK